MLVQAMVSVTSPQKFTKVFPECGQKRCLDFVQYRTEIDSNALRCLHRSFRGASAYSPRSMKARQIHRFSEKLTWQRLRP